MMQHPLKTFGSYVLFALTAQGIHTPNSDEAIYSGNTPSALVEIMKDEGSFPSFLAGCSTGNFKASGPAHCQGIAGLGCDGKGKCTGILDSQQYEMECNSKMECITKTWGGTMIEQHMGRTVNGQVMWSNGCSWSCDQGSYFAPDPIYQPFIWGTPKTPAKCEACVLGKETPKEFPLACYGREPDDCTDAKTDDGTPLKCHLLLKNQSFNYGKCTLIDSITNSDATSAVGATSRCERFYDERECRTDSDCKFVSSAACQNRTFYEEDSSNLVIQLNEPPRNRTLTPTIGVLVPSKWNEHDETKFLNWADDNIMIQEFNVSYIFQVVESLVQCKDTREDGRKEAIGLKVSEATTKLIKKGHVWSIVSVCWELHNYREDIDQGVTAAGVTFKPPTFTSGSAQIAPVAATMKKESYIVVVVKNQMDLDWFTSDDGESWYLWLQRHGTIMANTSTPKKILAEKQHLDVGNCQSNNHVRVCSALGKNWSAADLTVCQGEDVGAFIKSQFGVALPTACNKPRHTKNGGTYHIPTYDAFTMIYLIISAYKGIDFTRGLHDKLGNDAAWGNHKETQADRPIARVQAQEIQPIPPITMEQSLMVMDNAPPNNPSAGDDTKRKKPWLGLVRVQYPLSPALGDADYLGSWGFDVVPVVPQRFFFEATQFGKLNKCVMKELLDEIKWLVDNQSAATITASSGFSMSFQYEAANAVDVPVFMSSLLTIPMIRFLLPGNSRLMIATASVKALEASFDDIMGRIGWQLSKESAIVFMDPLDNNDYWGCLANGCPCNVKEIAPRFLSIVMRKINEAKAETTLGNIEAILFECTEMPPYSNLMRLHTGLPVFDSTQIGDWFAAISHYARIDPKKSKPTLIPNGLEAYVEAGENFQETMKAAVKYVEENYQDTFDFLGPFSAAQGAAAGAVAAYCKDCVEGCEGCVDRSV